MASNIFGLDHVDDYTADRLQLGRIHLFHARAAENLDIKHTLEGYFDTSLRDMQWALKFVLENTGKTFSEDQKDGVVAMDHAMAICQILRERLPILETLITPEKLGRLYPDA